MNDSDHRLHACEKEIHAIIEGCNDIVLSFSPELKVLWANSKTAAIVENPDGMSCHELFCGDKENCDDCIISRSLKNGTIPIEIKKPFVVKKGDRDMYFALKVSPVLGGNDEVQKVVVTARDITEQLRLERHLKHSSKMEAIGTLAGGIAHDFNNILTPIMGYSEILRLNLLQETVDREDAISYIDNVIEASKRAQKLVQQILQFSRNTEEEGKPQALYPIIKEGCKLIRSNLPAAIGMDVTLDENCGLVKIELIDVHQILINLCNNAVEAIGANSGRIVVTLCAHEMPGDPSNWIELSVRDDGCGIQADRINYIFDPYYTTKEKVQGTGMGLSIVHGIVSRQNGKVKARSEAGVGTTISIYLPAINDELEQEQLTALSELQGSGEHILLIDDESQVVSSTAESLQRIGYTVTPETSARKALLLFMEQRFEYDAVITDLSMPYMDGIELCKKVKDVRPELPVLLYAGVLEEYSRAKAVEAGVDGFCTKPATITEMAKNLYQLFRL